MKKMDAKEPIPDTVGIIQRKVTILLIMTFFLISELFFFLFHYQTDQELYTISKDVSGQQIWCVAYLTKCNSIHETIGNFLTTHNQQHTFNYISCNSLIFSLRVVYFSWFTKNWLILSILSRHLDIYIVIYVLRTDVCMCMFLSSILSAVFCTLRQHIFLSKTKHSSLEHSFSHKFLIFFFQLLSNKSGCWNKRSSWRTSGQK